MIIYRAWDATFAPILMTFSRGVVIVGEHVSASKKQCSCHVILMAITGAAGLAPPLGIFSYAGQKTAI